MIYEKSTDHLAVLGKVGHGDRGGMNGHESLAILAHEIEQILFLLIAHLEIAVGIEHYRVEVIQIASRSLLAPAFGVIALAPHLTLGNEIGIGAKE